jgi:Flp pilus assembly protein TadG
MEGKHMKKLTRIRLNQSARGQSFVELALVLPILLIMIAGIVDLSRFYFTYFTLRDAAQEGANYASVVPGNTAEITARVHHYSSSPIDMKDATVVVTHTGTGLCASLASGTFATPNMINVKATLTFNLTTPLLGTFIGQSFPVSANISTVILQPTC